MYAIIKTGGKQYRVQEGDIIDVELLNQDAEGGVKFDEVIFFNDGKNIAVGTPLISACSVVGELVEESKGEKVVAFKYKRRQNYRRTVGHRQKYSRIRIKEISYKE